MNDGALFNYVNSFCREVTEFECRHCDYRVYHDGHNYCNKDMYKMCMEDKRREEYSKLCDALKHYMEEYGSDDIRAMIIEVAEGLI